jgi:tryptophanyl-tRNA synthetase
MMEDYVAEYSAEKQLTAKELVEDNINLVKNFGASPVSKLNEIPDFYTFTNGLIYSHRDFDILYEKIKNGERAAIVSGLNASGSIHLGHIAVFDTNLFFQQKYGMHVFIPISDDESYVSLKVRTQEEGLKNSLMLARSLIAYGFDLSKTKLVIDQLYTDVYNTAIKLSRGINISNIKATYGYTADQNIGLHFYPAIQTAHIVLPQLHGIPNVLVPIAPDEDTHLRICRDVVDKFGYSKPAVLHSVYLPGLDGSKMSKSKGNAVFLLDKNEAIKKNIMSAFSGGQTSIEEHRKLGGNPDVDISYIYLKSYFLKPSESEALYNDYRKGRLLSGELKAMLLEHVMKRVVEFKERYEKVTEKDLERTILRNDGIDLKSIIDRTGVLVS